MNSNAEDSDEETVELDTAREEIGRLSSQLTESRDEDEYVEIKGGMDFVSTKVEELDEERLELDKVKTVKVREEIEEGESPLSLSTKSTDQENVIQEENNSNFVKTKTMVRRQMIHPLELNDKLAFDTIKTVRLKFLTDEAKAPIPRCQALPSHAFSKLTGRSILVSLSHGWFFQTHPDPYGEKLDLIRNVFAPQLRQRYPHTDIQVFFDYLASPQRPRTKEEDKVFATAMDRMNSMYVYADVIVFLEVDLPKLDMTIHSAHVDLSKYKFFDFVDTIQVSETKSKNGPQQSDCIQTCDSSKVESASQLNLLNDTHTLTYLYRPFGRPNTIINNDRGWLFLERITIAVKTAAADKSQFDDIVVSNSEDLRTQIFVWTEQLREAARKQKTKPRALRDLLEDFDKELTSKRFSFSSDESVVRELMTKLINQFADDWKGEVEKQNTMSTRAREILLRWGSFSEDYVKRAELLCDSEDVKDRRSWILLSVIVGVIAPAIGVLPFVFSLEDDGMDPTRDRLVVSSIWIGVLLSYVVCARACVCVTFFLFCSHVFVCLFCTILQFRFDRICPQFRSCLCKGSNRISHGFSCVYCIVCYGVSIDRVPDEQ